jgi:hypothetical protein
LGGGGGHGLGGVEEVRLLWVTVLLPWPAGGLRGHTAWQQEHVWMTETLTVRCNHWVMLRPTGRQQELMYT